LKTPSRNEITSWSLIAWEEISNNTIVKTYKHIDYEKKKERNIEKIIDSINRLII